MRVLWVGGTSALSRTYFEEVHPARGVSSVVVAAPALPAWSLPNGAAFVDLDLLSEKSVATLFSRLPHPVDALVIGVRLSLVWARPEQHDQLAEHVALLIQLAAWHGCKAVLHLSSIAVADHVTSQHLVREDDAVPSLEKLSSPYDRFKLRCEQIVNETCASNAASIKVWVNLRLSGLFSNDPACIQCTSVRRQWLLTVRNEAAIDFNSSRNVSIAIALLLERMDGNLTPGAAPPTGASPADLAASTWEVVSTKPSPPSAPLVGGQLFYYTRSTKAPVPYWHHVRDYRRANDVWYGLFLPARLGEKTLSAGRSAMQKIGTPLASSFDYLMAVAAAEHSADNSRFRAAFPALESMEETVEDAFKRIRKRRAAEPKRPARGVVAILAVAIIAVLFAGSGGVQPAPSAPAAASTAALSTEPTVSPLPSAAAAPPPPVGKKWDAKGSWDAAVKRAKSGFGKGA